MELDAKIESLLFWKAEPISIEKICKIFGSTEPDVKNALSVLEGKLQGRGVTLIFKDNEVAMQTSKDASEFIEKLAKEELTRDIGKAGLETLSIILYQSPISRRELDYIRGVNSNFILRNLLVRGLIEKIENEKDQRSFLYRPTFSLLSYLGISKIEELPEYATVKSEIEMFSKNQEKSEDQNEASLQ